ncbi:MAG TPA: hypothetical protein VIS47_06430 [Nitrosopumilus sp.]
MEESDEIQKLIDEISFRKSNSKNYEKMKAVEISKELRDIMKFEQESNKKIEEFGKTHENQELVEYAKIISRNTTAREIAEIQEIYLKKIDEEFLK